MPSQIISSKGTSISHFRKENKLDDCLHCGNVSCLIHNDFGTLYLHLCNIRLALGDCRGSGSVLLARLHIDTDILGTRSALDPFR